MDIRHSNDFAASPAAVHAMLTDPEFFDRLCVATGAIRHRVTADPRMTDLVCELPSPDLVRPVVGPVLVVRQRTDWESDQTHWRARMVVTVDSAPAKYQGTVELAPGGRGTQVTYAGNLRVNVPFLGATVEQAAGPVLEGLFERTQSIGDDYLARKG